MKDRKIGRFQLDRTLLEDCPDVFKDVLSRCIVVRCEMMFEFDGFEYTAICEDFQECPKGSAVRNYLPVFEQEDERDPDGMIIGARPKFVGWQ